MLELLLLALIGAGATAFLDTSASEGDDPAPENTDDAASPQPLPPADDDPSPDPFPEDPEEDDGTPPVDPTPVDPTPVDPTPVDPTPVDPTPVDPTPVDPTPVDPTPVDPTPVDPTPVDPTPVDPTPVDPTPVDPTPVDPTPVDPTPVDPTPAPVPPAPVTPNFDPEPADPVIDPTTVSVPIRDNLGQMVLRDGIVARGNALDNVFVGPTLTVSTPMGTISAPNGPFTDVTLHMGRGNDLIAGIGNSSSVYGNSGDDEIALAGSDLTLGGGEGNDTITLITNGGSQITGGLGNDNIAITMNGSNDAGDTVWGGAGSDDFGIVVERVEAVATPGGTGPAVTMMDFNPAQDNLTVVLSTDAQLTYTGAQVSNNPAGGYSELRLNFTPQGGGAPYQTVIRFDGLTNLSSSDIDLRLAT